MDRLPQEYITRFNVPRIDQLDNRYEDPVTAQWYIFLELTDHIPNKIIEAQALGRTPKDYTDILEMRQLARDKINGAG